MFRPALLAVTLAIAACTSAGIAKPRTKAAAIAPPTIARLRSQCAATV